MSAIIWLASYPRSGNTWTRAFLHNLLALLDGRDGGAHDINAMGQRTTWEIAAQGFAAALGKPVTDATRDEIAAVRLDVQARLAEGLPGLLFVKTHNALLARAGLALINTKVTAGAIYVVRNPLDVAISFAGHYGVSLDDAIARMAEANLETPVTDRGVYEVYGSWSQNVASWTAKPHRAMLVMRYEDMLADPLTTFGRLAAHLLLAPTGEQLERAVAQSSFEVLKSQEQEKGFQERPERSASFFRAGREGQWREALSTAQVERIVAAHKDQMLRFGYVPEGYV